MSESERSKLPPIEYRALRRREEGTFERLLCQGLIVANRSPPLKKINKMCENVMMTTGNPSNIDRDGVEVIHSVALAFREAYHRRHGGSIISWPFESTDGNYEKYVEPWRKSQSLWYYALVVYAGFEYEDEAFKVKQELSKIREKFGESTYFFTITTGGIGNGCGLLSEHSFQRLKSEFIRWALPKVQEWYMELTKLVDESVFDTMLKAMYGPREETTKEKE